MGPWEVLACKPCLEIHDGAVLLTEHKADVQGSGVSLGKLCPKRERMSDL